MASFHRARRFGSGGRRNAETLFNLIECAFVVENVAHFEALYAAAERWPALRARYASWFDTVRLDSPEVTQARAYQEQLRALENNLPPPIAPDPANKSSHALWKPKLAGGRLRGSSRTT